MSAIVGLQTVSGELRKYSATDSTATELALSDNTVQAHATTDALNPVQMNGIRGLSQLIFTGTDAANETFTVDLYLIDRIRKTRGPRDVGDIVFTDILRKYCSYAVTLGAKTGVADGVIGSSELFADTIVPTITTWGTKMNSIYGITHQVHSPADDTIAFVSIMDLFDKYAWVLDFDSTGAASMNAAYQLAT